MRPIKKFVLVVTPFGLAACASVWGFEDAVDRPVDGGGASVDDGPAAEGSVNPSNVDGVVCAPRAPAGFQGPLAFYTAPGASGSLPMPPACPDRFDLVYDGKGDLSAPALDCKCECDSSGLTECAKPQITFYSDNACTSTCANAADVLPFNGADCTAMNLGTCDPAQHWVKITKLPQPGGSCTPKATAGAPLPHVWGKVARLCEPKKDVTAQCAADQAPVPQTKLPYQTDNYCILTTIVDAECPGTYPNKTVLFGDDKIADTRSCGTCACGPATGSCTGIVQGADSAKDCKDGLDTIAIAETGCKDVKKSPAFVYVPDAGAITKCDPQNEGPKGMVQGTAPTTVCCRF